MEIRKILNEIYKPIIVKADSLFNILKSIYNEKASYGFFNNHFNKDENDDYVADYFPIPVISVEKLCDIEFELESIQITAKLTKENAVNLDYNKVSDYRFDIYGVDDYMTDYYIPNIRTDDLLTKINNSDEYEFFYTFYFNTEITEDAIQNFLKILSDNYFYY